MNAQTYFFPTTIFRAYDIRGSVALLTPHVICAIAHGLAQQFKNAQQKQVVIGYDARLSSPYYAALMQDILVQYGLEVTLIGCCSSPLMYYIARDFGGNGIMITASHNPKTDNGVKWILKGEPPCPDRIQQVAQVAMKRYMPLPKLKNNTFTHHIEEKFCLQYQHALLADIQLQRPFKVVIDGLYGSAGRCASFILKKLGCEVITLRCEANGHFPEHAPDPSQATHLRTLQQQIILHQADIGIALDGDGDRLVLVDEKANIITADRLLALFAEMCLRDHPQHEFVYDVKCSTLVRHTVENFQGQATMIRTGSSFLRKYLLQSKGHAVFGGEYAGHYVFNDGRGFGYDDGLYAALRVLEYLSQQAGKMAFSALMAHYPERYCTEDTYIPTYQVDPVQVLADIEVLSQNFPAQLSKIDGVRLDFADGFGLIRASNTGEYFTVRFDADNATRLNEIRHTFVSMLSARYPKIAQDILQAQ